MASSSVGGLSGAFIPVSEDEGMIAAASSGALTLDKLEAMTCVCSVGLDMIAVPGDTSAETIAAIIADEAAIGMVNTKTTAVRIIPAPGCRVGDTVEFGGLLGSAPVQAVHPPFQRGLHRPRRAYPRAAAQPEKLKPHPVKKRTLLFSQRPFSLSCISAQGPSNGSGARARC